MKKRLAPIVVGICMAGLGVLQTACSSEQHNQEAKSEAVPVLVGKVRKVQEQETISVSGTVSTPNSPVNVGFLVPGKVAFVGPREGDHVDKGQRLAAIDTTDYQLDMAAAKAQTDSAKVSYKRTEDEHRRMKMLYDSKSLAPNDYLKFKAAFASAAEQYKQAVVLEKLSRKRLADATLYAPTSGYIAKRMIEPGDIAAQGRPVFEIVQMDPLEVNVGVPETDVHLVRVGEKATITVPALPGKSFEGTVRIINVSADSNTRTYMTRIAVENPEHLLRVGMVAEATIRGNRTVSMVTLPGDTVVRDPQGATQVFVYYPDQKRVYAKRVEVGTVVNQDVEIRNGLDGNELIVLAGQTKLRNGMAVAATAKTGRE